VPGDGEVLVRVHAAGLNGADMHQLAGGYPAPPGSPQDIPGLELAGEVVARGPGAERFDEGDRVMSIVGGGGQAELAVVHERVLMPVPENLSWVEAGGVPEVFTTAHDAVFTQAQLQMGERLLVHGAAGGVGLAAVDLARIMGARVVAASASDHKLEVIAREYAPDATVNVTGGFRERVKEITGGRGADVIYDPVGGDVFDESLRCIAFGGRILSIGFTSGRLPVLPVNIALIKGFSVIGVRAGEYGRQFPEKGRENHEAVWKLAEAGKVKPRVDAEYPLDAWRAAFDSLADRKVIGKTVVRPDL
jgi:NADPH2:quinone reductase